MSGDECRRVWALADHSSKAPGLDAHSPRCACEVHSLRAHGLDPVDDEEILARIITSPDAINLSTKEILTAKLTAIASSGVSLVRRGASDDEIERTVAQLVNSDERPTLVGAAIFKASAVRQIGDPERLFCIYDTYDDDKDHHADIVSTTPNADTRSQFEKAKKARRKKLAECLEAHFVEATSLEQLKHVIRSVNR